MNYNLKTHAYRAWMRFHERFLQPAKLAVAHRLHAAYPTRFCWADCVAYAYSCESLNPLKIDGCGGCKKESIETGNCYCGQWCNGRSWSELSEVEKLEARGETEQTIFEI